MVGMAAQFSKRKGLRIQKICFTSPFSLLPLQCTQQRQNIQQAPTTMKPREYGQHGERGEPPCALPGAYQQ